MVDKEKDRIRHFCVGLWCDIRMKLSWGVVTTRAEILASAMKYERESSNTTGRQPTPAPHLWSLP